MFRRIYILSAISLLILTIFGINIILNSRSSAISVKNNIFPLTPTQILGGNFVVGIPDKEIDGSTIRFLEDIRPAGVVLYYRNYEDQLQFKSIISELQNIALRTTGQRYFIMIDEEPGGATRLDLFGHVFDSGMPDWEHINKDVREMADLGINVDFAPLADFPFNKDTFIRQRIAAHTPEALVDFNTKFISLLQNTGISATLKHFPGMGVFVEDPHKTIPHTNSSEDVIDRSIQLFKKGIDDNVDFVMTSHAIYDAIDQNTPVTLSKKIVTGILRNDLKFNGLIITDDLSDMPFIVGKDINLIEGTAEAIKAGHNLVIFSHEPQRTEKVYKGLLEQMKVDPELESMIKSNYDKISYFKKNHY